MRETISKTAKQDWRDVQRRRRFRQFYLETGNAVEAAKAAGYAEVTARTQAARMAARVENSLQDECEIHGITKAVLVIKLKQLLDAKEPRWNAKRERWDHFENATVQIAAYDRLKAILEREPPTVINHNIRIGVAIDVKDNSPDDWIKRNAARLVPAGSGSVRQTLETTAGAAVGGDPSQVGD